MLKLKHKIEYAVKIAVDFLVRNTNEAGLINEEQDLLNHCLATLCMVENTATCPKQCLSHLARYIYVDDDRMFIPFLEESKVPCNATAALIFLTTKPAWAVKFANRLLLKCDKQISSGKGHCLTLFLRLYETTQDNKWKEAISKLSDQIIEEKACKDIWSVYSIYSLQKIEPSPKRQEWLDRVCQTEDLDLLVYGQRDKNWEERVKQICYARLERQIQPSDEWHAGAFRDQDNEINLALTEKYVRTFNQILKA